MKYDVSQVLSVADAEVGYLEKRSDTHLYNKTANVGYNNYTKYGKEMHALYPAVMDYPAAWCDAFVDWCFYKAYGKDAAKVLLCGDFDDYTPVSAQYYKDKGRFYTGDPMPGDQIFFKNSSGTICHTGLVYLVDKSRVYTIEGNTSGASGVIANGGGVCRKSYAPNYGRIAGYGRPNYDMEATEPVQTMSTDAAKSYDKSLAGTYVVTASALNLRAGAGQEKQILAAMPKGQIAQNYGYYTAVAGTKWLYILWQTDGISYIGFASGDYLKRV